MILQNKRKILLVEDNPYDAEMTVHALKSCNPETVIHVAKDGAEALDYLFDAEGNLKDAAPAVILLDLKLPKVDGVEVLRRIKSDERSRTIPVVMLTSSNQESDLRECYRFGVNSYVTKPVEFESFTRTICDLSNYWLLLNRQPGVPPG